MPKWEDELNRRLDEAGNNTANLLDIYQREFGMRPSNVSTLRAKVQRNRVTATGYLVNHNVRRENPLTISELSAKTGIGYLEMANTFYPDVRLSPWTVGAVQIEGDRHICVRGSNIIYVWDQQKTLVYVAIMKRLIVSSITMT